MFISKHTCARARASAFGLLPLKQKSASRGFCPESKVGGFFFSVVAQLPWGIRRKRGKSRKNKQTQQKPKLATCTTPTENTGNTRRAAPGSQSWGRIAFPEGMRSGSSCTAAAARDNNTNNNNNTNKKGEEKKPLRLTTKQVLLHARRFCRFRNSAAPRFRNNSDTSATLAKKTQRTQSSKTNDRDTRGSHTWHPTQGKLSRGAAAAAVGFPPNKT